MSMEQQTQARRQALRLLADGWTQKRASQAVGVGERTVRQWVGYRRAHGLAALLRDERGRKTGQGRTLSAAQEKAIRRLIMDQTPDQLKLPFALWTRKAVGQLIQRRYGLRLPVRTLGEYLKRWGFTVQKPVQKALEQKPAAVRRWLRAEDPAIVAQAKAEGGGDLLGRSDWVQQPAQRGAWLCAARPDATGAPECAPLHAQRDECRDQQRQSAVDGLQRGTQCLGPHWIPGALGAAGRRAQSVPDSGQSARASQCPSQTLAGEARWGNLRPPSPQLQPRTQPGRVAQPVPQKQTGRPARPTERSSTTPPSHRAVALLPQATGPHRTLLQFTHHGSCGLTGACQLPD